ncbi:MAG TPA: PilZ domain-containing protein [Bryobacterales bacterium]|nr:PilZ domain-containing protein [Bryobacterales bacterium]
MTTSEGKDRRKSHRYLLTLPCRVVRARREAVELRGRTHNLSSKGAFFVVDGSVEPGAAIEFLVTLHQDRAENQEVCLRCRGHVIRLEEAVSKDQLGVAATIDRFQFIRRKMN